MPRITTEINSTKLIAASTRHWSLATRALRSATIELPSPAARGSGAIRSRVTAKQPNSMTTANTANTTMVQR